MENAYESAKKSAIEKVFLVIAETGRPTREQLDFLEFVKDKKKESIKDVNKEIESTMKMFDMIFGIGGK